MFLPWLSLSSKSNTILSSCPCQSEWVSQWRHSESHSQPLVQHSSGFSSSNLFNVLRSLTSSTLSVKWNYGASTPFVLVSHKPFIPQTVSHKERTQSTERKRETYFTHSVQLLDEGLGKSSMSNLRGKHQLSTALSNSNNLFMAGMLQLASMVEFRQFHAFKIHEIQSRESSLTCYWQSIETRPGSVQDTASREGTPQKHRRHRRHTFSSWNSTPSALQQTTQLARRKFGPTNWDSHWSQFRSMLTWDLESGIGKSGAVDRRTSASRDERISVRTSTRTRRWRDEKLHSSICDRTRPWEPQPVGDLERFTASFPWTLWSRNPSDPQTKAIAILLQDQENWELEFPEIPCWTRAIGRSSWRIL